MIIHWWKSYINIFRKICQWKENFKINLSWFPSLFHWQAQQSSNFLPPHHWIIRFSVVHSLLLEIFCNKNICLKLAKTSVRIPNEYQSPMLGVRRLTPLEYALLPWSSKFWLLLRRLSTCSWLPWTPPCVLLPYILELLECLGHFFTSLEGKVTIQ